ncbi:MAG TPA: inositol monophosphatase [Chthonomonadales bacterium]|nr:inositol monophosphatase [Chthonomonadales bacterium]
MTALADVEVVKKIVVEAGQRALEHWGRIEVELKPDTSMVTAADRETEQLVEERLAAAYPGYAFVGEEYGWRGPRDAPIWACDPIDGTTNFVAGLPHWCVSVGLLHRGVPELGAVYLPVLDELYWGVRGQGAWCNGQRLEAEDGDDLHPEDMVTLTSSALKTLNTEALVCRLRCIGSIATELVYTARGHLRGVVGLREGIVDVGAALCICAEAGCRFHYLRGPAVDVASLLEQMRTQEHFVYAPPRRLAFLQRTLRCR